MKKTARILTLALAMIGLMSLTPAAATYAAPAEEIQKGVNSVGGGERICEDAEGNPASCLGEDIKTVVNILLYILGAIAVVMIVIGGVRYVTSNGESSNTKAAKDTILYAVIGLIVAIMAYAIVNFVITAFIPKPS